MAKFVLAFALFVALLCLCSASKQFKNYHVYRDVRTGFAHSILMQEEHLKKHAVKVRSLEANEVHVDLSTHFAEFGVRDPTTELAYKGTFEDLMIEGLKHVLFSQVYHGIPVYGTHISVHIDADGNLLGINGVYHAMIDAPTEAQLTKENALNIATEFAQTTRDLPWSCSLEGLFVYSESFAPLKREDYLAYVAACAGAFEQPSLKVVIDATNGNVLAHSDLHQQISRLVRSGGPDNAPIFKEGDAIPADTDTKNVLTYMQTFYDAFKNFNYVGLDNKDSTIEATVNVLENSPAGQTANCPNAFYVGNNRMLFCQTFVKEDVTFHEMMHGVIDFTTALVYAGESGATNEALADIVAESFQILKNSAAEATAYSVQSLGLPCTDLTQASGIKRWVLSETGQPIRYAFRYMRNPACARNPRTTKDTFFQCDRVSKGTQNDNGGVHINSGVVNQMFSLLVDGGKLNTAAPAVTAVDIVKALNIFVHSTLNKVIPSGTTFPQLAGALRTSCTQLINKPIKNPISGAAGTAIVQADCDQLNNAIQAVGLEAGYCGTEVLTPGKIVEVYIPFAPVPGGVFTSEVTGDFLPAPTCVLVDAAGNRFTSEGAFVSKEFGRTVDCPVPPVIPAGTYTLKIVDASNVEIEAPQTVTVYKQAKVNSITPPSGKPSLEVTITGDNFQLFKGCGEIVPDFFGADLDCLTCFWGTGDDVKEVAATFVDASTIKCKIPDFSSFQLAVNPIPLKVALDYFTPVNSGVSFRVGEPTPALTPLPSNFLIPPISGPPVSVPRLFRRKN